MKLKSIQLLLLLTFSLMQISFDASAEKPTNFILIYIDDMGYGDIALTGAIGYTTPNLDKMAASGMFFSRYYSPQAVCSASRAGLLTGCYPNRVGFRGCARPHGKNRD
jgi:arylsulfatase A-like enzyme